MPDDTPIPDRQLALYALLRLDGAEPLAAAIVADAVKAIDNGERVAPFDELTRRACAAAAVSLQRTLDNLPPMIARLQTLSQTPTKELPL